MHEVHESVDESGSVIAEGTIGFLKFGRNLSFESFLGDVGF